jgi:hypothetical protein
MLRGLVLALVMALLLATTAAPAMAERGLMIDTINLKAR